MTADELRRFADALEQLAELRCATGIVPGEHYDRPKIHFLDVDESWELEWVDGPDGTAGHYTADLVVHR